MIPKSAAYLLMTLLTCEPAPRLAALFTPARPIVGRYDVCTAPDPVESLVSDEVKIDPLDPLEAFGTAGPYPRFALARLYGSARARVARRWIDQGDHFESQTFISPYPDATLTHLVSGTMIIKFRITRGLQSGSRP